MIGPLFDMFTETMFTFSSARLLNMCKPRTGWATSIGIIWKWASKVTDLAGDCECRLAQFPPIRNKLRTGWATSIGIIWKWASKVTDLAGDCECRLAQFPPIRNFLENEIYHFSRLSHHTGCLFTLVTHSI